MFLISAHDILGNLPHTILQFRIDMYGCVSLVCDCFVFFIFRATGCGECVWPRHVWK